MDVVDSERREVAGRPIRGGVFIRTVALRRRGIITVEVAILVLIQPQKII